MPTFIMLTTLTSEGVQTVKNNPSRIREVNREIEREAEARRAAIAGFLGSVAVTDGAAQPASAEAAKPASRRRS